MRIKKFVVITAFSALALAVFPAHASSAYHMNGQGSINIGNGGLPACLPVANVPNCVGGNHSLSWGELTVQGAGLLQDAQVLGNYSCVSEKAGTGGFSSSINGNTSNFLLTFNFQCTLASGSVGPPAIDGFFTNNAAEPRLAGYPYPVPTQAGVFSFAGFFKKGTAHSLPSSVNGSNGAPMFCSGGFAPESTNGTSITAAAFLGECNAVQA